VMGVNLMGVIHCNRSFIPIMIEQDTEGHIVSTASIAGLIPGSGIYGVTKHAVVALSESLWNELRDRGTKLKASVLCPGFVNTRIMQSDRNRPEAPREAPGEQSVQGEMMRKAVEGLIQSGLDPAEVGRMVVDAVKQERFYILTHPWNDMIEHRVQNILQNRDPIGIAPADGEWLPVSE
ncbi:MAG: SDR family NAD(P)-dependent oxidoreductase, partial [Myxococcota bacterium]